MEKIKKLILFNESRCNLNCIYCYTHSRRSIPNRICEKDSRLLIKQAKDMGAMSVMFAGPGEFLLHKRNLGLIDYVYSEGMQPVVFTNGLALNEEVIEFLFKRKTGIILKLHSLNKETYDLLAGKKTDFKWIKSNFRYDKRNITIPEFLDMLIKMNYYSKNFFKNLKSPITARPYVCIESVITRQNIIELPIIAQFAQSNKIDFLVETLIQTKKIREIKKKLIPDKEDYQRLKKELVSIFGKRFEKSQDDCSCMINNNPVIYEDGCIGICFVKPSNVNWFDEKSLSSSFSIVKNNTEVPKIIQKNGFRSCYGRESALCERR